MISDRLQEQASLYVLGALPPGEHLEFENTLQRDPELQKFVTGLLAARDAVAGNIPAAAPSDGLKQRLMAALDTEEKPAKVLRAQSSSPNLLGLLLPWALTVTAVVLLVIGYHDRGVLNDQLQTQSARIDELNRLADELRGQTNSLQQTVVALQETNRLASVRIALLGSLLNDSPKAVAVSLWDNQQQSGVFVVQNLKPLPADRDYQLWVIDPHYKTPVSAGVFQVDNQGNVRIRFHTDKLISTADKFAVTLEPKGGLPTPTLKNLVLAGG